MLSDLGIVQSETSDVEGCKSTLCYDFWVIKRASGHLAFPSRMWCLLDLAPGRGASLS